MEKLTLVIFGITSNLSQIKLLPALYDLEEKNLLPDLMNIIGVARSPKSRSEVEELIASTLNKENRHHQHEIKQEIAARLCSRIAYLNGELSDPSFYQELKLKLQESHSKNIIYYLATYPNLYSNIFKNLSDLNLNQEKDGWVRLMIEKPIGNNLESARALNRLLCTHFKEEQIYRLDHYLGKETLQNLLTFRFGNNIFEHIINKDYVDNIQVTAFEDFGIGKRGGYYDLVGALKDVGQNHLLQMLAFATMEQPSEFSNLAVTNERTKLLKSLIPNPQKVVFGQYSGYTSEENVDPNSKTETFFAFKTEIGNDRFKGVPIYLRAGKMLKQTVTEVAIVFKKPKNCIFEGCGIEPNILIYRIQPNEGIILSIMVKKVGHEIKLEPTAMEFCYKELNAQLPDPYERLLSDTIRGDQTFFNDAQEIEAQWASIDPLAKVRGKPHIYNAGSWGPKATDKLIEDDDRSWLEPSMDFCRI